VISPHITDEFDEGEPGQSSQHSQSAPILVAIQVETTSEVAEAIRERAEEIGKTPAELAGLLLSCAVMLWRAGDTAQ
jgi:NTP pyrophosphatase (non-canonical NTP hydrolase)